MTTFDSHTVIIPQCDDSGQSKNMRIPAENMRNTAQFAPYSTVVNAPFVHSCQASENGVECWRHAEIAYRTASWLNFPSETRYLCKMHYALLWHMVLMSLLERAHSGESAAVA